MPIIEACPAEVLKEAALNLMKALQSMIGDLEDVVVEYSKFFEGVCCLGIQ